MNTELLPALKAYRKLCVVLHCVVTKPVSQVIEKSLLLNHNYMKSCRDCFLSTECVFVGMTGQHSSEVSDT